MSIFALIFLFQKTEPIMDAIHIHLLLNHIPILGTLFGILLLLAGLFKNNRTLIVTALVTFVASALIAIPTNISGEGAEDAVEKLQGVTEQAIHEHEEAAEPAFAASLIVGALSLVSLFFMWSGRSQAVIQPDDIAVTRVGFKRFLPLIVLFFSLASFFLMVRAGNLGGHIRHTELNSGGTTAPAAVEPDGD